jgi:uncharacterized repeat protein (TIGR01451 family)
MTAGTQYINTARVGGGGDVTPGKVPNPSLADVNACTGNDIPLGCAVDLNTAQNGPQIRLSKTYSGASFAVGATVPFSLTVTNSGGAASTGTIRVFDALPAGLAFSGTSPFVINEFTCTVTGQNISCDRTTALAAGTTAAITFNAIVQAAATNTLVNRAKVGGGGDPQNNVAPTAATASACIATDVPNFGCAVATIPLSVDLQIAKFQRQGTNGAFLTTLLGVPIGATVQFLLGVTNPATSVLASGVTFTDTIPANFTSPSIVSSVASGGATGCTATLSGNTVSGSITTLPAGSACAVLVQVTAATSTGAAGVTNTAVVAVPAGLVDTVAANNTSSVNTVIGIANVSIAKSDSVTSTASGNSLTYSINVSNAGPSAADGTRVSDTLRSGLSACAVSGCTATGAAVCPAAASWPNLLTPGGVLVATLPAGGSITFALTCTVSATGSE